MVLWPQIDDRVQLVREDGQRCSSRVRDDGGPALAVAEPLDPAWRAVAQTGEVLEVQWHSARGLHRVSAVVAGHRGTGDGLWWLEPTDEPEVQQRRSFARGAAAGVAAVLTRPGDRHPPHDGWLLDLGEGGARVRLPDRLALAAGEAVRIELASDGRTVAVEGTVLRSGDVPTGTEVIVVFPELPEASATRVRQLVFALQRQNRR